MSYKIQFRNKLVPLALAAVLTVPSIVHAQNAVQGSSAEAASDRRADSEFGSVAGVINNASGDRALDAEVRIIGVGLLTAVDEEGRFSFENVPAGPRILEAVSPRWGQGIVEIYVASGVAIEVTVQVLVQVDLEEILVSAGPLELTRSDAIQSADALSHQALVEASEGTLGETLNRKVGINSTYFGPGASRPIIRGVGGNRVGILQQGLAVVDASDVSPDHTPAIESLLADRIEIIRGPATLLFGSSAIGGVVNVLDGRIPFEKPTSPFGGTFTGRLSSVSQGRTGAAKFKGAFGNLAWALSGLTRATEDFRVPKGSIEVEHDDHHDEDGDDHDDDGDDHDEDGEHEVRTIEHSNVSLNSGSAGLSYVGSWGFIGASASLFETDYGVPGHEHHEHDDEHDEEEEEEEAGVRVGMDKFTLDVEGNWRIYSGILHGLRFRFGSTDYQHDEYEHDEVGTTFEYDVLEGRLEVDHVLGEGFHGVVGLQFEDRDLRLSGDEAYLPNTKISRFGLFLLERLDAGPFGLEAGLRFESADLTPVGAPKRSFSGISSNGGVNYRYSDGLALALSVARSIKIPHPGELYADGHHVATQAYEIGDADLDIETVLSLDASVHITGYNFEASASAFSNNYSGFIFLRHTEEVEDGAEVFRISQDKASFRGFEVEAQTLLYDGENDEMGLRLWSDYTRAERTNTGEPLPRIPPLRFGAELSYELGALAFHALVTSVSKQDRVEEHETTTDGYVDLGAAVHYRFFAAGTAHILTLQGRNLGNVIARPHTSFLKDEVPLPGRDFRLTYRLHF